MEGGCLMERAPTGAIYPPPPLPNPYVSRLCFPPMHGKRVPMEGIPGSPPDLRDLPSGCAFHPRCQWAMDRCRHEVPQLAPLNGSSREVACWLHRDEAKAPPELSLPDPVAAIGQSRIQVTRQ